MDNEQQTQPPQQTQEQKQTPYETQKLREQERRRMQEQKPKKSNFFRNCLIIIVVILLVLIVGVAVTGLYEIPVISSLVGANKPKDLGIKTSPEALASIKEKVTMKISSEPIDYTKSGDQIFSGEVPVDTQITSEELTSWLNRFQGSNSAVTNVQVKKIEGGIEMSAMLDKYVKAPIYAKVMVNRVSEKSIDIDFQKAKVGFFSMPDNYLQQAEDFFEKKANERIADTPGFSIEQLEYHDGYSIFKGTFPANAKPSVSGWTGLFR